MNPQMKEIVEGYVFLPNFNNEDREELRRGLYKSFENKSEEKIKDLMKLYLENEYNDDFDNEEIIDSLLEKLKSIL